MAGDMGFKGHEGRCVRTYRKKIVGFVSNPSSSKNPDTDSR